MYKKYFRLWAIYFSRIVFSHIAYLLTLIKKEYVILSADPENPILETNTE